MKETGKKKGKRRTAKPEGASASVMSTGIASPVNMVAKPVVNPHVLRQQRDFSEALRQTKPLAVPGTREAGQAAETIGKGSAHPKGLQPDTAKRLATNGKSLNELASGANPQGKAAEVVVAADYLDLHAGLDPAVTNPPKHLAPNLDDIRVSPDNTSRKDMLFQFRTKEGLLVTRPNGQVKTGAAKYIADELATMAKTPGYGKVAYVDARFVNPDGSPRVAPDAFTDKQAQRLQEGGVKLRGIKDLDARASELLENIKRSGKDGLGPHDRAQFEQLRSDIAHAYRWKGVAGRMAKGAAVSAATATLVTLVVQAASDGKVDASAAGDAAGDAALIGAGGALADAGLCHLGKHIGLSPEKAQIFAQSGIAAGFFLWALGTDIYSEGKAAHSGETSKADAAAGSLAKAALNTLPFALSPLGWVGVPLLIGAQLCGRWGIEKARQADRRLTWETKENLAHLEAAFDRLDAKLQYANSLCDDTDRIFQSVMAVSKPHLHSIKR